MRLRQVFISISLTKVGSLILKHLIILLSKLTDFTNYTPYPEREIVQTANVHDSLMIHGEGTVFFDTETTNGQIHTVHLDNVCYIPNRSN